MIQTPLRIALAALLCASLFLLGCSGFKGPNSNTETGRTAGGVDVKDDIEDLNGLINLAEAPEEVSFVESEVRPGDLASGAGKEARRRLLAVLRYEGEPAKRLSASVAALGKGEPVSLGMETWYPAELVAKSQTGGEESLRGIAYPAAMLAKAPYTDGRMIRVEGTDYYVVELYAR